MAINIFLPRSEKLSSPDPKITVVCFEIVPTFLKTFGFLGVLGLGVLKVSAAG